MITSSVPNGYLAILPWKRLMFAAAGLCLAGSALALEPQEPQMRQVSFSVESASKIDQDLIEASLYYETQRLEAADAAAEVNNKMAEALKLLEGRDGLEYSTLAYQTYPVYEKSNIEGWRVRQVLQVSGQDKTAVTEALTALQKTLSIQSLEFVVSRGAREETNAQLTKDVLAKFKQRAQLISTSMDAATYEITSIQIDTQGGNQPNYPRAEMMMARDSSGGSGPALEAGKAEIVVSANATIELVFDGDKR
ncbi:SIMPL domain-containing protein [Allohahella marinimesophila]|uniref:SIMPL domain-containing protein n=1 Tax=Allohahella marinimesophila TaxID=1054972 RepID=A0ABP7NL70_9GAMM